MAIEYTSSPVEQPGTQMRIGALVERFCTSCGNTSRLNVAKVSASRKNEVKWISRSWYRFWTSSGCWRRQVA